VNQTAQVLLEEGAAITQVVNDGSVRLWWWFFTILQLFLAHLYTSSQQLAPICIHVPYAQRLLNI
jgi:hypothetical protein